MVTDDEKWRNVFSALQELNIHCQFSNHNQFNLNY